MAGWRNRKKLPLGCLKIFPGKAAGVESGGICFEHEQRKADEACRARPKRY